MNKILLATALAAMVSLSGLTPNAHALTQAQIDLMAQLNAQIQTLQGQLVQLKGQQIVNIEVISRDLGQGSRGDDVKILQASCRRCIDLRPRINHRFLWLLDLSRRYELPDTQRLCRNRQG